jgi:hypothetical protein
LLLGTAKRLKNDTNGLNGQKRIRHLRRPSATIVIRD